jgi:hypothetical protein
MLGGSASRAYDPLGVLKCAANIVPENSISLLKKAKVEAVAEHPMANRERKW